MNQRNITLFGYFPLLNPAKTSLPQYEENPDKIQGFLTEVTTYLQTLPSGRAEACIWYRGDDGEVYPVFVMEQGDEIAAHLKLWAENKPEEWFSILHAADSKGYGIVLMPIYQKSVRRAKFNIMMHTDEAPLEDGNIQLVFSPLSFYSRSFANYQALNLAGKRLEYMGIIDIKKFKNEHTNIDDIHKIGPCTTPLDDSSEQYLKQLLERESQD